MKKLKKLVRNILIMLFWTAVWQLIAVLVASEILLPTPLSAFSALLRLGKTSEFYLSVLFTVVRISAGFLAGLVLGILTGAATYKSRLLNSLLSPLAGVIKSTPVASFTVLLFVWFSNDAVASITSMLIVLPIVWGSTYTALSSVEGELSEMANFFGVSLKKKITEIYIPSALPAVRSSALTAMGLAWKAGVAAEVICSPKNSIGGGIYSSKIYLETPELFAWTAVVIIVSMAIEKLLGHILTKAGKRRGSK